MRIAIITALDVRQARRTARDLATALGFGVEGVEAAALVATEMATNLVRYAHHGEVRMSDLESQGMQVESHDGGPGIAQLDRALTDGYSTGGGMGGGLPSIRRLADEFEIASGPDGTRIVARMWLARR